MQIACGNGILACMSRDFGIFMPKHLAGQWCVNSNHRYIISYIRQKKRLTFYGKQNIINTAKKSDYICHRQSKNPRSVRDFWGFLFRLCKVAYTFRLLLPVVPVQPFANEVANNICRNRNKKSDYKICHRTSPPFCWRFGSF